MPERYFSEDKLDVSLLSWDFGGIDWNVPGVHSVKLFYDGKETNCTIEVQILSEKKQKAKKVHGNSAWKQQEK